MKTHANALSNTTLHRIRGGKYKKIARTVPPKDMSKEYEFRPDGWRKKKCEKK